MILKSGLYRHHKLYGNETMSKDSRKLKTLKTDVDKTDGKCLNNTDMIMVYDKKLLDNTESMEFVDR